MQKFILFLAAAAIIAAALYVPASYQVVRMEQGSIILHKRFLTYGDSYIDARKFTSADFDRRPELKRAMIDAGYSDLLADLKTRELKEQFAKVLDQAQVAAGQVAAIIKETVDKWLGETGTTTTSTNLSVPVPAAPTP